MNNNHQTQPRYHRWEGTTSQRITKQSMHHQMSRPLKKTSPIAQLHDLSHYQSHEDQLKKLNEKTFFM